MTTVGRHHGDHCRTSILRCSVGVQGLRPVKYPWWMSSVFDVVQAAASRMFLTTSGLVDVDQTLQDIQEQTKAQLGEGADDFMKRFRFQVNEQGLP